jgi:hypothetical protein
MALTAHRVSLVKTVLMALLGLPARKATKATQVTLALSGLRVRRGLLVRTAPVLLTRFRLLRQRFWVV